MPLQMTMAEIAQRLQGGWTLLKDTCPVTGFPLLLSPPGDGRDTQIVWSVRCKCQVITQEAAGALNIWESGSAASATKALLGGKGLRGSPLSGGKARRMMVRGGGHKSSSRARDAYDTLSSTAAVLEAKMDEAKNRLARISLDDVDGCCKLAEFIGVCGKALSNLG